MKLSLRLYISSCVNKSEHAQLNSKLLERQQLILFVHIISSCRQSQIYVCRGTQSVLRLTREVAFTTVWRNVMTRLFKWIWKNNKASNNPYWIQHWTDDTGEKGGWWTRNIKTEVLSWARAVKGENRTDSAAGHGSIKMHFTGLYANRDKAVQSHEACKQLLLFVSTQPAWCVTTAKDCRFGCLLINNAAYIITKASSSDWQQPTLLLPGDSQVMLLRVQAPLNQQE